MTGMNIAKVATTGALRCPTHKETRCMAALDQLPTVRPVTPTRCRSSARNAVTTPPPTFRTHGPSDRPADVRTVASQGTAPHRNFRSLVGGNSVAVGMDWTDGSSSFH